MVVTGQTNFLTSEEMAVKLRISIRKLQLMMKDGTAPDFVRIGSRILFPIQ